MRHQEQAQRMQQGVCGVGCAGEAHPHFDARALCTAGACCCVLSAPQLATDVHDFCSEIIYTLDVKDTTASQTLGKREGMCTNKANLQVQN